MGVKEELMTLAAWKVTVEVAVGKSFTAIVD